MGLSGARFVVSSLPLAFSLELVTILEKYCCEFEKEFVSGH